MPLGPISWAARAERMGMGVRTPAPAAPTLAPSGFGLGDDDDDPDAAYQAEMREIRDQDRLDRLADLRDEAEDRRLIRRLRRKQELGRLQAQLDPNYEPPGRGRGGGDDVDMQIEGMRRELQAERNALLSEVQGLRGFIAKSNEDTLKGQLDRLSAEIAGIRNAPGADPLQTIVNAFEMAGKIRGQVDSLMPTPPPAFDPGLSHEQALAHERAVLEHDIYRLEREESLETVKLKRDQIRADREKAQQRLDGIMGGVRDVAGALAGALSPAIAGMLPAGIGGGNGGGPGAIPNLVPGAAPVATGPPPAPAGIPYVCPSSTCRKTNYVPPGTGIARCDHCGYGPIWLQPEGAPAPPGMVRSV